MTITRNQRGGKTTTFEFHANIPAHTAPVIVKRIIRHGQALLVTADNRSYLESAYNKIFLPKKQIK